jgi:hypothetical protein
MFVFKISYLPTTGRSKRPPFNRQIPPVETNAHRQQSHRDAESPWRNLAQVKEPFLDIDNATSPRNGVDIPCFWRWSYRKVLADNDRLQYTEEYD